MTPENHIEKDLEGTEIDQMKRISAFFRSSGNRSALPKGCCFDVGNMVKTAVEAMPALTKSRV
jgi:hypothetical protein